MDFSQTMSLRAHGSGFFRWISAKFELESAMVPDFDGFRAKFFELESTWFGISSMPFQWVPAKFEHMVRDFFDAISMGSSQV
jgi:hypothetical protein